MRPFVLSPDLSPNRRVLKARLAFFAHRATTTKAPTSLSPAYIRWRHAEVAQLERASRRPEFDPSTTDDLIINYPLR